MGMGQGVVTGVGHRGITCVFQAQFSSFLAYLLGETIFVTSCLLPRMIRPLGVLKASAFYPSRTIINPFYLETHKRVIGNSADPGRTPHTVASDQGLLCLLTEFSIKIRIKVTK